MAFKAEDMEKLAAFLAKVSKDPLKFAETAFPWGKGVLKNAQGPLDWQKEVLRAVSRGLEQRNEALRIAVASGHGVGKSALAAWIILWSLATRPNARGVVTANTETQLKTKTWAELAKWHAISPAAPFFTVSSSAIHSVSKKYEKTWRIDMVPWNPRNTESFAGLHNSGGRIALIFDEASAIPQNVWEVAEGALTDRDTEIIWLAFGNPTRPTGRFYECFGRFRHRWKNIRVDSRTAGITNKAEIEKWIADYGEDSDFVKVRVRGEFPENGGNSLIPPGLAEKAAEKWEETDENPEEPLIMGIDAARFGDDSSVIVLRRGMKCLSIKRYRKIDTMALAAYAGEVIKELSPDGIFADQTGVGAGVTDRLLQSGFAVTGVDFGGAAGDKVRYFNKRAEMWSRMALWLKKGGAVPKDGGLIRDLSAPEYSFCGDKGQMILEKKESMKKRGLASPDAGDALALTFAFPVGKRSVFEDIPGKKDISNDLTITKF